VTSRSLGVDDGIYTDGSYLDRTGGTWHLEDSPFKAQQIARMLARHPEIKLDTICEIGCGAGGILVELEKLLPGQVAFTGFDISPQAHAISKRFSSARRSYILGNAFTDASVFDVVLVMDVVEHVEDCFSFLRQAKRKGQWKLYHIPLETHASATLRGVNAWDSVGHLHLFTIETALKTMVYTGHRVVDWMLTDGAFINKKKAFRTRLANLVRLPISRFSTKTVARLIGGYSILILAE
jgi:hypothetical protein